MKILITGASGFIGRNLLQHLLSTTAHQIMAISRNTDFLISLPKDVRGEQGDLDNLNLLLPAISDFCPEVVIHLAWDKIPDFGESNCLLNLQHSIQLIDLIVEHTGCKKLIMSGTCLEYGKKRGMCIETDQTTIDSFFSWSKQSLYNYASLKLNQKWIDLIWFRIFYVYGPYQRSSSLIPNITQSFLKGQEPTLKAPTNRNDFIYIGDVVTAFAKSIEYQTPSGIYNLGSGNSTSVVTVCRTVVESVGKKQQSIYTDLDSEPDVDFWANIDKSKRELGWQPEVSLSEGINKYLLSLNPKRT